MGASILGPSLALAGAAVCLVALETVPRLLVEGEVDACGLEDLDVRLSTTPLAWQAATGGFRSEVRVPADVVTAMVADQLAEGTLVAPQVTLTEDVVLIDAVVDAPMGRVPIEVHLDVSVEEGRLVLAPREVHVAGRVVPADMVGRRSIGRGLGGSEVLGPCTQREPGRRHRVTGVDVDPAGLVLTVVV